MSREQADWTFFRRFSAVRALLARTGSLSIHYVCRPAAKQGRGDRAPWLRPAILVQPTRGPGSMRRTAVSIVIASMCATKTRGATLIANGVHGAPWRGITCLIGQVFLGTSRLGADLTNVGDAADRSAMVLPDSCTILEP